MAFLYRLYCIWLILAGLVPSSKGADTGCDDWTISSQDSQEVCCTKCKPGNRLVKSCGKDPALLCRPCESNQYITNLKSDFCMLCTQCTGVQITHKACNITSDTVCRCKDGYRCGNDKCSYCVTECREGEEPTNHRSCRKCPEGKFNDKIHSMCQKWKQSCPNGYVFGIKGSVSRDHECLLDNAIKRNTIREETNSIDSLQVGNGKNEDKVNWIPVGIAGGVAVLGILCIIASVTACVRARHKTEKPKPSTSDPDLSEAIVVRVEDQDVCSYRHPQQEQGGSSESISSQDSESKLIV